MSVTGDVYLTFTQNPDSPMKVFPGDEIDALLDAATSTMLATTGFSLLSDLISFHIKSDARADPPGESTRITTAFTWGLSRA